MQLIEFGLCARVVEAKQGLSRFHDLTFPSQEHLEDAAFQVADRLALRVDDDRRGCDRGTVQMGRIGPGRHAAEAEDDRCQAGKNGAAIGGAAMPIVLDLIHPRMLDFRRLNRRDFLCAGWETNEIFHALPFPTARGFSPGTMVPAMA